jgi:general secretion pathway protein A
MLNSYPERTVSGLSEQPKTAIHWPVAPAHLTKPILPPSTGSDAMYFDFFGFREAPFSIAPDPRYLYMSERHREALAHLLYGINSEGGFVLLTGEVGTGKTTVCRCLLEQVPAEVEIAFVLNPRLSTSELLAGICDELRIAFPEGNTSIKLFTDRINARLLENHARGAKTVLIIDEAQNLDTEVLEQIRLLTNLETNERKLLQVILLGQPELREKLARPELRQLSQRITARYHLEPLTPAETEGYIRHRLATAGVRARIFSPAVIRRVHNLSKGIPRRINVLCDRCLLGAYVQGKEEVDRGTVVKAAREAFEQQGSPRLPRILAAGILLLLLPAALLWQLNRGVPATSPPIEEASPLAEESHISTPLPPFAGEIGTADPRPAFAALFGQWNIQGEGADFCAQAREHGLACLSRLDGLDVLRRFNLPAVLTLTGQGGENTFAALTALGKDHATFRLATGEVTVPLEELKGRWGGEYTLLWRRPPFQGVLAPGAQGTDVAWLARRLAQATGKSQDEKDPPVLRGALLRQLKEFQFSQGLAPDGVAGPFTLVLLDVAQGGVPTLGTGTETK